MVTKEDIRDDVVMAIRNMNRNIYEWNNLRKRKHGQSALGFDEVHGLAKNWLVRRLRKIISHTELSHIFRRGNLSVSISGSGGYVTNMRIMYDEGWQECRKYTGMINDVFASINYEALKYDGAITYPGEIIDKSDFVLDFSSIERINF